MCRLILCLVAMFAITITGCGGGTDRADLIYSVNRNNGERLANAYAFYQNQNGVGPSDLESFKEFIQNEIPVPLKEEMGIAGSIDELFVSERDNQPFFVCFEVPQPTTGSVYQVVVTETQGVGGTIKVFYTGPKTVDVPASDVEQYRSGEKDIIPGPPQ